MKSRVKCGHIVMAWSPMPIISPKQLIGAQPGRNEQESRILPCRVAVNRCNHQLWCRTKLAVRPCLFRGRDGASSLPTQGGMSKIRRLDLGAVEGGRAG